MQFRFRFTEWSCRMRLNIVIIDTSNPCQYTEYWYSTKSCRGEDERWNEPLLNCRHRVLCLVLSFALVNGGLRARRLCCLRRETAFSPESAAGSSEVGSYRSPFCSSSRRGADRREGVLELAYYRAAKDGQAFPTRERHRVLD